MPFLGMRIAFSFPILRIIPSLSSVPLIPIPVLWSPTVFLWSCSLPLRSCLRLVLRLHERLVLRLTPKRTFTTQFNGRRRIRQPIGSGEVTTYTPKLSDSGDFELVESGKRDLYGEIQSHRDSCDIYVLLNRYQNGDLEALSRVQGSYGDFTQMPKTFAEVLNAMIAGEQMFNSLPLEVRQKFDFSLEKFMLGMDNMPDWLEKVGVSSQNQEEPPEVSDPAPSGSPTVKDGEA